MSLSLSRLVLLASSLSLAACTGSNSDSYSTVNDDRPNILLIIADDLGYADLGVHGSIIRTPNIDELAGEGLLMTQFHTAPMCAPTRAMLLSGNNNHVAGMARQSRNGLAGNPVRGYENSLSDRVIPFPRLLQDVGYHTYVVGKWHLGLTPDKSPTAAGFSRSFNMLDGAGNHWDNVGFFEGGSTFWADGDFTEYPAGEYSTEVYTNKLIEFIDANAADGKPFFAMAAYTSPHWPLQVPDDQLDLYAGEYDDGYDALRERNFEALKSTGIIPADSTLPPRNTSITPWDDLDADQQRRESRKMELYAAMVENLDQHVGRVFDHLKAIDEYDNTLVIFMSDNGAAAEDFYNSGPFVDYLRENYDNTFEKMGTPESFVSYDDKWAEAGSAPFKRHKTYTTQGGIVAPMIMAGAGVAAEGGISSAYTTVTDLAPTFLEIAGASYPDDGSVEPMVGASLVEFLSGKADDVHSAEYITTLFHRGRAYLRQGDWKLVTLEAPFEEKNFLLFNLADDPGESQDLSASNPDKRKELIALWRSERRRLGIILPQDL